MDVRGFPLAVRYLKVRYLVDLDAVVVTSLFTAHPSLPFTLERAHYLLALDHDDMRVHRS